MLAKIRNWNKRYIIITSEGLFYSKGFRKPNNKIREMLLFDNNFSLVYGERYTGKKYGIMLRTTSRRISFSAEDIFQFLDIITVFKDALEQSPYISTNRFDSFAPERDKCYCKYYIDGEVKKFY
jgi:phospholipase D1/2